MTERRQREMLNTDSLAKMLATFVWHWNERAVKRTSLRFGAMLICHRLEHNTNHHKSDISFSLSLSHSYRETITPVCSGRHSAAPQHINKSHIEILLCTCERACMSMSVFYRTGTKQLLRPIPMRLIQIKIKPTNETTNKWRFCCTLSFRKL